MDGAGIAEKGGVMTNEEVLAAFEEFLVSDELAAAIAVRFETERLVAALREFGQSIEPIPLAKATQKQMTAFVRDHGQVETVRNPLEQRVRKQQARLRRTPYEAAMLAFKHLRREVLRKATH
jgi:hypothetical protein